MTRPYTMTDAERSRRAEAMRKRNADHAFADLAQRRASLRTKRLHEADRWRRAWEREAA